MWVSQWIFFLSVTFYHENEWTRVVFAYTSKLYICPTFVLKEKFTSTAAAKFFWLPFRLEF